MATRRVRKSRKGGVRPGKSLEQNIRNCKKYWSSGKDPSRCELTAITYDYPGRMNKYLSKKVRLRNHKTGEPFMSPKDIVSSQMY